MIAQGRDTCARRFGRQTGLEPDRAYCDHPATVRVTVLSTVGRTVSEGGAGRRRQRILRNALERAPADGGHARRPSRDPRQVPGYGRLQVGRGGARPVRARAVRLHLSSWPDWGVRIRPAGRRRTRARLCHPDPMGVPVPHLAVRDTTPHRTRPAVRRKGDIHTPPLAAEAGRWSQHIRQPPTRPR